MTIAIVDYGIGNIRSIQNAFERLYLPKPIVTNDRQKLRDASGLILPGVGAFSACSVKLDQLGLGAFLTELVIDHAKPILGICVGMQIMANHSTEGGLHKGLGWISGEVIRLEVPNLQVPHVGWNNVQISNSNSIFSRVEQGDHFYFDHSYHLVCDDAYCIATTDYGGKITVAVQKKNIFGVQFHPEKSANAGLKLFRSFEKYIEEC